MILKIKKINPEAVLPKYAHEGDAGMDVYSVEDCYLKPMERRAVTTGLIMEIPEGHEIQVRAKSGLALNHGIALPHGLGTIDEGYRGELKILLINFSDTTYEIKKGQKIAQIVLAKYEKAEVLEIDEIGTSSRADGGFGSTGLN